MAIAFTDFKNYPHGFRRSGEFSIKEAERLERYGHLFQQLLSGKKPENDAEKDFLKQLTNKSPVTAPEVLAWNKYQKKISESKQYFPLCSTPTDIEGLPKKAASEDDDDADIDVDTDDALEEDDDDLEVEET